MITNKQAKEYRLKLGLSQNFISKATGLSRPYLSNFEAGKFNPDHEFKETLQAFFIKQGIKIDDMDNELKGKELPKENNNITENQNINMDNKVINGIVVNTNNISYSEAKNILDEVDLLNGDLLELSDKNLPVKKGFFGDSIDAEKLKDLIFDTIFRMAKSYKNLMEVRGLNNLPYIENDLPDLAELTTDDNFSIADYISHFIESGWSDEIEETE